MKFIFALLRWGDEDINCNCLLVKIKVFREVDPLLWIIRISYFRDNSVIFSESSYRRK